MQLLFGCHAVFNEKGEGHNISARIKQSPLVMSNVTGKGKINWCCIPCRKKATGHEDIPVYNPSNIFARARLVKTRHVGEFSPAKTGEYPRIFPNFQNVARCVKDLKDNKDNSLHLGRKYARIFVLGHYLFLVDHSFPRATLSENCSLRGTDNVRGQISEHIFAPNGGYCLYTTKNINTVSTNW